MTATALLLSHEFRAMGTEVAFMCPDGPGAALRLDVAGRWIHAFEGRLSRFIPYSELSRLNAAQRPFRASPLLFNFVRTCLELAARSGGVFDPTLLHQIEAAGYDRTFDDLRQRPAEPPYAASTAVSGHSAPTFRDVRLDLRRREITLPPGLGIDSGGLGKGWAADRVGAIIRAPCLVDCGGDILAAGRPEDAPCWYVGVQDPFAPDYDLALLGVADRGVATSSTLKRAWTTGAGTAHHLIDPRTGGPSDTDVVAATVVAPTATLADFYAKVALLKGATAGLAYLEDEAEVEGLLVTRDGRRLETAGLAAYLVSGR